MRAKANKSIPLRANFSANSGFTLLELVLAVSIMGVILYIIFLTLTNAVESKRVLDERRDTTVVASAVLSRLTRELQLAYNQATLMPPRDDKDRKFPPRVSLLGEEKSLSNGRTATSITFLAMEGGQYLPDGGTHSGLVQISYKVMPNPDHESTPPYYLVREELPYIRPFERAYERSMNFPVTSQIAGLEFKFMDANGTEWLPSWGNESHAGLPKLIRFTLVIQGPSGRLETYSSTVALRAQ